MKLEKVIEHLKPNTTISRKEYGEIVRKMVPNISERTIYWQLARLQEMGAVQKVGQNAFYVKGDQSEKREYTYDYSNEMK